MLLIDSTIIKKTALIHGTPLYLYDENYLIQNTKQVLNLPNAYGMTVRYAMKACPNASILRSFSQQGIHIDASSGFEAERAILAGIPAKHIQITAQEIPKNLKDLMNKGVLYNACSLQQIRAIGEVSPNSEISIRVNPGLGDGHTNRTNTGGPSAGFGIWYEDLEIAKKIAKDYNLKITRLHSHIGSGVDINVWQRCTELTLKTVESFTHCNTVNLGGGYKIARMPDESSLDMQKTFSLIKNQFEDFYHKHQRKLHLEIEPGTYLIANAGYIVASIIDITSTGKDGYNFIKIDAGMSEIIRPSMYGAQHPISLISSSNTEQKSEMEYLVVGHCCESGDILTPSPKDAEGLLPRKLPKAEIGDLLVIGGAGAYCAGFAAKHYNSFPEAPEVLIRTDGKIELIRKRQTLEQMLCNEM